MKTITLGDQIHIGEQLGDARLISIENSNTITVEKNGQFYRVSGLELQLAGVAETYATTTARLRSVPEKL